MAVLCPLSRESALCAPAAYPSADIAGELAILSLRRFSPVEQTLSRLFP